MSLNLFDNRLRELRRNRAKRAGSEPFLHERAFDDILDRLSIIQRRFHSALLIGCREPGWQSRLSTFADTVEVVDADELLKLEPAKYDLCVAVGSLDTLNDLRRALLVVRLALRGQALFIGALPGGDTLPQLRAAMRAADAKAGVASPHIHPRIEPAALSGLLGEAGFTMPVVDVDRVEASYRSLWDLVHDLRAMEATNVLAERSKRPLTRVAAEAAVRCFAAQSTDGRTIERFELLHFAAWTPPPSPAADG